jgi:hypothetical protein
VSLSFISLVKLAITAIALIIVVAITTMLATTIDSIDDSDARMNFAVLEFLMVLTYWSSFSLHGLQG